MAGFPNVPDFPGVPALPRDPLGALESVVLLVADVLGLFAGSDQPLWGLFLDGAPAVVSDNVAAFGFRKGFSISTYPLEQGSFESYNKVQRPFHGRVRFTTGGAVRDRQEMLQSIDNAVSSLELFDIVTPEVIYTSVNPVDYSYDRAAVRGTGLLSVDVNCEQVRTTAMSAFSTASTQGSTTNAQSATGGGAGTSSTGSVTRGPDLASPISNPQDPGASPFVNGGTVQPVQAAPGQFDITGAFP